MNTLKSNRLAACALLLALAACGGGDDEEEAPPPASAAPPAATPAPTPVAAPSPTPSPAPSPAPISPRACSSGGGTGSNGLELYGTAQYSGLTVAAGATGNVALDPGEIRFVDASQGPNATTGSLRVQMWAVAGNYSGGSIQGYVVTNYPIRFTDGSNQLRNGQSSNLTTQTLAAQAPPKGSYCMVLTLEQFDSQRCSAADRYCISDWMQFPTAVTFQ